MVKSSKYKHVYADDPKSEDTISDLPKCATDGEGNYCAASSKFIAVGKAGSGGPVMVLPLEKMGRQPTGVPTLATHQGRVYDMAFCPSNPYLLATGSEDAQIHLHQIPKAGLTETVHDALSVLGGDDKGHQKKISLLSWNRATEGILASGSYDRTVKIWDSQTSSATSSLPIDDNLFSLQWDNLGTELGFCYKSSKGTQMCVTDPRSGEISGQLKAFQKKTAKMFFHGGKQWVGAFGFKDGRKRYLRIWDRRKFVADEKVLDLELDNESSVLMPYFDEDINLLWVYGKGSGAVNFYELGGKKHAVALGGIRNSTPCKGGCFIPKIACDTSKCEIARFMKLEIKDSKLRICPYKFIVPRKSTLYQDDIYPDTYSGKSLLTDSDWLGGKNVEELKKCSMNPANRSDNDDDFKVVKKATYGELAEENKALKKRIEELEAQLGIEKKTEEQTEEKPEEQTEEAEK